ncbi:hypothetical protein DM01DRAFT_1300409 [Hesseltinella vesiculosa]|uniref:Uncharacterized protein n=1 Tax=Hesseltinella vesiculosa TaxID=101127 RepID=A0A1X2GSU4_9FUNG|nr:hypothetical protein DM01DRAFT_1300409 [Hesseltinella vesiculosa]
MLAMTTYAAPLPNKSKKPYKSWLKDGVAGGPCSMDILIQWLSVKANVAKWRGDEAERTPKKVLLENILDIMRQHGIHHRLAKDIASKISTLQSNYRTAREWNESEGKRLRDSGMEDDTIHEELVKRFPYWDALHSTFGPKALENSYQQGYQNHNHNSWPMSISSIMHKVDEEKLEQTERLNKDDTDDTDDLEVDEPPRLSLRRRRSSDDDSITSSLPHPPMVIRPMPRSFQPRHPDSLSPSSSTHHLPPPHKHPAGPHHHLHSPQQPSQSLQHSPQLPHQRQDPTSPSSPMSSPTVFADSLVQIAREKEAGRMKRSQDMLEFLREKRTEREHIILEKERTKRIKAKADLVKNMLDAGFSKDEITEQLDRV